MASFNYDQELKQEEELTVIKTCVASHADGSVRSAETDLSGQLNKLTEEQIFSETTSEALSVGVKVTLPKKKALPNSQSYRNMVVDCFSQKIKTPSVKADNGIEKVDSRMSVSPAIQSQLRSLRRRFTDRTKTFKQKALQPLPVDEGENEEGAAGINQPAPIITGGQANDVSKLSCFSMCLGKVKNHDKTISPQSYIYLVWLFVVTVAYIYNLASIILRATFTIYYTKENFMLWLALDYSCDLVYIIDLVLVKPRIQFIQAGILQTNTKETKKNYRRSGDFKLDLMSLLPLDIFYCLVGVYGGMQSLLRLPRYLKLRTAWEFFDRCDQVAMNGYIIRVIRSMTYMLFLVHVEACIYYAVSVYEGIGSNGWVYSGKGIAYIRCFYLAMKTATSIGDNPTPTNQLEYLFMTCYWLSGVFVFALLIGQIRDIFESANSVKADYQLAQDSTLQYLQNLNVPKKLQVKVREWFVYNWEQQKTLNENQLIEMLPNKMKTDLLISVHYETLSKVSLFQDCDKSLLSDLILKLKPVIFLPGDYICRKGEIGTEMYIIMHGEVDVVNEQGAKLATLSKGKVFGEISLMGLAGGSRRTATVRSSGYSNLFTLSKVDFEMAMEEYPTAYALLKKKAKKLLKRTPAQADKQEDKADNSVIISLKRPSTPKLLTTTIQMAAKKGSKIMAWLKSEKAVVKPEDAGSINLNFLKDASMFSIASASHRMVSTADVPAPSGTTTQVEDIRPLNTYFVINEGVFQSETSVRTAEDQG